MFLIANTFPPGKFLVRIALNNGARRHAVMVGVLP
jgi:hypothetical protein